MWFHLLTSEGMLTWQVVCDPIELVMLSCIMIQMLLYIYNGYTVEVHSFIFDSL